MRPVEDGLQSQRHGLQRPGGVRRDLDEVRLDSRLWDLAQEPGPVGQGPVQGQHDRLDVVDRSEGDRTTPVSSNRPVVRGAGELVDHVQGDGEAVARAVEPGRPAIIPEMAEQAQSLEPAGTGSAATHISQEPVRGGYADRSVLGFSGLERMRVWIDRRLPAPPIYHLTGL